MSDLNFDYVVVLTTVSSKERGVKIANCLLSEKLAACVNIFEVESLYTWQEVINCDREWQLIIKTRCDLTSKLKARIASLHEYEIPELIVLPIVDGSQSYLQWLRQNLQ